MRILKWMNANTLENREKKKNIQDKLKEGPIEEKVKETLLRSFDRA